MNIYRQLAFVLGGVALVACGSGGNPTNPDAAAPLDASQGQIDAPTNAADAPLVTTVDAAPQVDSSANPDAATSADATQSTSPVTVTVYDLNNIAAMGLPVAFLNADNSVILETTTDVTGSASSTMPNGGSVTVGAAQVGVDGDGNQGQVFTWLGVHGGDALVAGTPNIPSDSQSITLNVASDTTGDEFFLQGYCADGETFFVDSADGSATTVTAPASCTTADIYVTTVDSGQNEIAASYTANVALADNGDLALGTLVAVVSDSVTVSSLPDEFAGSLSNYFQLIDGTNIFDGQSADLNVVNGAATGTVGIGAFASIDLGAEFYADGTGVDGSSQFFDSWSRGPSIGVATINFDYAALGMANMTSLPTFDVATASLSWTEGDTGTADAVTTGIGIASSDGTTRAFTWNIVAPHQGASLTLPTLPASISDFTVLSTDLVTVSGATLAKGTVGYDVIAEFMLGTPTPYSNFDDAWLQLVPNGGTYTTLQTSSN